MIVTRTIEEHALPGRPLGRHVHHDPASRNFTADQAQAIKDVLHAAHSLPLTQTRGSCTAEALIGSLDSDPDYRGHVYTQTDADHLYDREIVLEGGDPKRDDPGGSGLMVCKAAKKAGLINSYQHAFGFAAALRALVLRPMISGVNWYDSFDRPDKDGTIHISPGASVRGGHEFVLTQIITASKVIGAWNSWGKGYGLHGRFFIPFDVFERLLHEQGDVTVPLL